MSDRHPETGATEAHVTDEGDGNEYAVERLVTREAGATALRRLADGVANGSIELGDEEVTVAVPERFQLEIEYDQDDEEAELEAELEWPIVDGEAVATERRSEPTEHGDTEEPEMGEDEADLDHAGGDEELVSEDEPAAEAEDDNPIEELVGVGATASKAQFELYRDRTDEWRWRLVHDNGNIIADSGEGYDRKATARNGLESVIRNAPGAPVVVRES